MVCAPNSARAQACGAVAVGPVRPIAAINASRPACIVVFGQLLGELPGTAATLTSADHCRRVTIAVEAELGRASH